MPSRLPTAHSRDVERILGKSFGFSPTESQGGSHQVWIKTCADGTVLAPTLLRDRQYRPNTLRGLLEDAMVSQQSFAAIFHKRKKGHRISDETQEVHQDIG
jgi:hypothetical protein